MFGFLDEFLVWQITVYINFNLRIILRLWKSEVDSMQYNDCINTLKPKVSHLMKSSSWIRKYPSLLQQQASDKSIKGYWRAMVLRYMQISFISICSFLVYHQDYLSTFWLYILLTSLYFTELDWTELDWTAHLFSFSLISIFCIFPLTFFFPLTWKVAIKIQRPYCEESIGVDMFIMRWWDGNNLLKFLSKIALVNSSQTIVILFTFQSLQLSYWSM